MGNSAKPRPFPQARKPVHLIKIKTYEIIEIPDEWSEKKSKHLGVTTLRSVLKFQNKVFEFDLGFTK